MEILELKNYSDKKKSQQITDERKKKVTGELEYKKAATSWSGKWKERLTAKGNYEADF